MTKLEVTGYEGSPTPRRRCLAYALDSVPRWSAVLAGTAPVLMLLAALSFQDLLGVGIFDPSAGGDPILIGATVVVSGRALRWLLMRFSALDRVGGGRHRNARQRPSESICYTV